MQKIFEDILLGFFSFRKYSKTFLIFNFLFLFFIFDISKADTNFPKTKNNKIDIEYLESKNELEDYIVDTGDYIYLEFYPSNELSGVFPVNEEGELFLPRLDETFVRGLTISELKNLLERRYSEFLIEPDIKVKIAVYKDIRVLVKGELRNPGFYKFPAYNALSFINNIKSQQNLMDDVLMQNNNFQAFKYKQLEKINLEDEIEINPYPNFQVEEEDEYQNMQLYNQSTKNVIVKRSSESVTTISDVIKQAGGITSNTDLSKIEIIRDIPLGKGGGKKRAYINFNSYLDESDPTNDIRIFDGDTLFFPKLSKADPNQIPKSVFLDISPKFISVNLFGRVETPGFVKLPLEATLSDAIDLTGPIKPLSGKIVLIRYENDGTFIKKKISYSANAKRGSKRNPYLKENDLIGVKNSIFGRSAGLIKAVTEPFAGIYSTKKLIEEF